MSDSDNELQSSFDEYVSQHGRKPSASQLSKFAGCKYSEASRFLRDAKVSSKSPSSTSIEQKTKPTHSRNKQASVPKPKQRVCKQYTLDMTAAEFGACKCGFSKADHFNRNEDESTDDENELSHPQNDTQQPIAATTDDIKETQETDAVERAQETDKRTERIPVIYENVTQDNEGNAMEKSQDTIKKLQAQIISKQREINKSYQEKEGLKKTVCEQKARISQLKQENNALQPKKRTVNTARVNKVETNVIKKQKVSVQENKTLKPKKVSNTFVKKVSEKPKVVKVAPKESQFVRSVSSDSSPKSKTDSFVSHSAMEKKFLCYAIQKLGAQNEISFGELFTDILFEQVFEGLPGTLFGAKNKKIVKYASPMLMYPGSKEVMIELNSNKLVDTSEVKQLIVGYIEKHMQKHTKDNLLFLLEAMDQSKEAYVKACKCFEQCSVTQKRA